MFRSSRQKPDLIGSPRRAIGAGFLLRESDNLGSAIAAAALGFQFCGVLQKPVTHVADRGGNDWQRIGVPPPGASAAIATGRPDNRPRLQA